MPPAAVMGVPHICPASDGPKPHVGGPVVATGAGKVLICGLAAAVVGDTATCIGPPDKIVMGSSTVYIGGKQAARMGDSTAHGGKIIFGVPVVQFGG